jgi:hypothetical protein
MQAVTPQGALARPVTARAAAEAQALSLARAAIRMRRVILLRHGH